MKVQRDLLKETKPIAALGEKRWVRKTVLVNKKTGGCLAEQDATSEKCEKEKDQPAHAERDKKTGKRERGGKNIWTK